MHPWWRSIHESRTVPVESATGCWVYIAFDVQKWIAGQKARVGYTSANQAIYGLVQPKATAAQECMPVERAATHSRSR